MNLEELQRLKKQERITEIEQAKIGFEYSKKRRKKWGFLDINDQVLFDKNNEKLSIIANQLKEWYDNAKNETQQKKLLDLFMTVTRISCYVTHLETVSKHAVSLYREELEQNKRLISEKRILELKLQQAERDLFASNEKLKNIKDDEINNF